MKYLLALLLTVASITAQADNRPWTDSEKKLFVAHTALVAADWGQTRSIAKHPDIYEEANPLLGKHPSTGKVDAFFIIVLAGSYLWFDALDTNREKYMIYATVLRGVVVGHNYQLGVRIGF